MMYQQLKKLPENFTLTVVEMQNLPGIEKTKSVDWDIFPKTDKIKW